MLTKERIERLKEQIGSFKMRCSAISSIMTYSGKDELPTGAKTAVESFVDQIVYDFQEDFSSKYTDKGNAVEEQSIELYNSVFFTNHQKAFNPASNEYLTTQSCDIDSEEQDKIIDIKSSWSLKTFPKTKNQAMKAAKKSGYDWQLQGYMSIFGRSKAEIAYCFIETPEELCSYENQSVHTVNNEIVPEELLVTIAEFEFNKVAEAQIFARVELCRKYALEYFNEILEDHGIK